MDLAVEAVVSTVVDGGYTGHLMEKSTPTDGYMVGGVVPTYAPKTLTVAGIQSFIDENQHLLIYADRYIGTWDNGSTVDVDVSEWFGSMAVALEVGRARGEVAIWDVAAGEEIYL